MNDNEQRSANESQANRPEDEPVPAEKSAHDAPPPDDAVHARLENQLQRAMADLANLRKRQARELTEARQRAIEAVSLELLPVLDNFHLALGATQARPTAQDSGSIVEGLKMVRSMLESVLERHGLTEIPAEGEAFDPNLHEAVGLDQESDAEPGTVTTVVQRGYRIQDKVLRPTRVIVRGEPDGGDADAGPSQES